MRQFHREETHDGALFRFQFDAEVVRLFKTIPVLGRQWVPSKRSWWIRGEYITYALYVLMNEDVSVEYHVWDELPVGKRAPKYTVFEPEEEEDEDDWQIPRGHKPGGRRDFQFEDLLRGAYRGVDPDILEDILEFVRNNGVGGVPPKKDPPPPAAKPEPDFTKLGPSEVFAFVLQEIDRAELKQIVQKLPDETVTLLWRELSKIYHHDAGTKPNPRRMQQLNDAHRDFVRGGKRHW